MIIGTYSGAELDLGVYLVLLHLFENQCKLVLFSGIVPDFECKLNILLGQETGLWIWSEVQEVYTHVFSELIRNYIFTSMHNKDSVTIMST